MEKSAVAKLEERQILALIGSFKFPIAPSIVDVGGNVGAEISEPYIKQGWRSLIVEPQSHCVRMLEKKYGSFSNTRVIQGACSFEPGELKLFQGGGWRRI